MDTKSTSCCREVSHCHQERTPSWMHRGRRMRCSRNLSSPGCKECPPFRIQQGPNGAENGERTENIRCKRSCWVGIVGHFAGRGVVRNPKNRAKTGEKIKKRTQLEFAVRFNGRGNRIRTCDFLVPNQALYQTELLPVRCKSATISTKRSVNAILNRLRLAFNVIFQVGSAAL